MKESQFGFSYSWADLKPIRALPITVFAAQLIGSLVGYEMHLHSGWFESLWTGGALATFPSFLAGLLVQARLRPGSLHENAVMVRRLGLITLSLTLMAVFIFMFGFGHAR
ncbi:MAG: hypothetical protein WCB36_03490 [Burkholderiales bacterium]